MLFFSNVFIPDEPRSGHNGLPVGGCGRQIKELPGVKDGAVPPGMERLTFRISANAYKSLPDNDIPQRKAAKRWRACAVVGNSGVMLAQKLGADIDKHDMVRVTGSTNRCTGRVRAGRGWQRPGKRKPGRGWGATNGSTRKHAGCMKVDEGEEVEAERERERDEEHEGDWKRDGEAVESGEGKSETGRGKGGGGGEGLAASPWERGHDDRDQASLRILIV